MVEQRFGLLEILEIDQKNVEISKECFGHVGITEFFERLLNILDELGDVLAKHNESSTSLFVRQHDGTVTIPLDLRLRVHMLNSAWNQILFAASHLYRAQASEVYSHTRRAIEAAGIAHLSKSEPDIGEIYFSGNTERLRDRTYSNKILPSDNPLTKKLRALIDEAASQQHNNFVSMVKRMKEEITDQGARGHYQCKAYVYDADKTLMHFWKVSYHILTSGYFVARLLADSFSLPSGTWHQQLDEYKADIDNYNVHFAKAAS